MRRNSELVFLYIVMVVVLTTFQIKTVKCSNEGEVRLAESTTSKFSIKGRLEIYHNGIWGTVCDDSFGKTEAGVVCGQLWDSENVADTYEVSGGSGSIWLDNLECSGLENSLIDCRHSGWGIHDCSHHEDVGIICRKEGAVRLSSGTKSPTHVAGRLEILHNKIWGTVCASFFNDKIAAAVCRHLDLNFSHAASYITSTHGSGQIWLGHVVCNGTEEYIGDCLHSELGQQNCTHNSDVAISCFNISEEMVRLNVDRRTNNSTYGRLEIYQFGIWGTVCTHNFNFAAAEVVCRQLGQRQKHVHLYTPSPGSGDIWLSNIVCNGSESTLSECSTSDSVHHDCTHSNDVGISCFNETEVELRLQSKIRTSDSVYGILEIKYKGIWGTVCNKKFNEAAAKVVCLQLGEKTKNASFYSRTRGSGHIWLSGLVCNGSESVLSDCSHSGWGNNSCSHTDDVSISCFNGTEGNIRLAKNMTSQFSIRGRLEVFHNGIWGTVCDDNFGKQDAMVVCIQLEMSKKEGADTYTAGGGSGLIWLDDLACSGFESSLIDCDHKGWGMNDCHHGEDVGVICQREGAVQLVDNRKTSTSTGRLEILHNNIWGTVCGSFLNDKTAIVACRQLGTNSLNAASFIASTHGTGQIWLGDVVCNGNEEHLGACSHSGWGQQNCSHNNDIAISCFNDSTVYGRLEVFKFGIWGTVCNKLINSEAAKVMCRQLGERTSSASFYVSSSGIGHIWLNNVVCDGSESTLGDCSHSVLKNYNCTHRDDVSLSCFNGTEGKLRLSDSTWTSNSVFGRLEVYHKGIWGTVCNTNFNNASAEVACRELGKGIHNASVYIPNSGRGHIWLSNIICDGHESALSDCSHSGWGNNKCRHSNDVGIRCFNKPKVNGNWRSWSNWNTCSVTCGLGFKTRQRSCDNPSPVGGGEYCTGKHSEFLSCLDSHCPVNGAWSRWLKWTTCSSSCGDGYMTRTRECNSPEPTFQGSNCSGEYIINITCNTIACPELNPQSDKGMWISHSEFVSALAGCILCVVVVGIFGWYIHGKGGRKCTGRNMSDSMSILLPNDDGFNSDRDINRKVGKSNASNLQPLGQGFINLSYEPYTSDGEENSHL